MTRFARTGTDPWLVALLAVGGWWAYRRGQGLPLLPAAAQDALLTWPNRAAPTRPATGTVPDGPLTALSDPNDCGC